jgi:hypothetical protein
MIFDMTVSQSKEGFMKKRDIPLQVLLRLLEDPLLKIDKIESVRVLYLLGFEPFHKEWEMVGDFLPIEDAVNHMATEQPHLDLVSCVGVDLRVLVNRLKNVRSSRPV